MRSPFAAAGLLCIIIALGACTADALRWRHYDYVVQAGDTLYSVAWRYDLDYRDLACWNHIRSPYTIYVGEHLVLSERSARRYGAPPRRAPETAPPPVARGSRSAPRRSVPAHPAIPVTHDEHAIAWRWPARGTVIDGFDPGKVDAKGINIGGAFGEDVRAAASGRVVYSGSGLIGYGQLIIIKHNDHYLSAYAHNRQRFVHEGDEVKAGEKIATMGRADGKALLHFEIRRDGKPVDPMDYLPSRN